MTRPMCVFILGVMAASIPPCMLSGEVSGLSELTLEEWTNAVGSQQKLLVVFYKEKDCALCQKMVDVMLELAGDPDMDEDIRLVKSSDPSMSSILGVGAFPTVVFLREASHLMYDGKPVPEDLIHWMETSRDKVTQHLNEDSFEHLTQASSGATTGDWLVAFYQDKCGNVVSLVESVGVRIRQKTNVAVVNTDKNPLLADRFSIKSCPQIILFKQGKMYRYELPRLDQANLKSFVDSWHRNSKAEVVLPPKSKFDYLTEAIADHIKVQLEGENRIPVLSALGGIVALIVLVTVCCCRSVISPSTKAKTE